MKKIICIIVIYIIVRDAVFVSKLSSDTDYRPFLIDTKIVEKIFESDNTLICGMAIMIVALIIIIIILMGVNKFIYKKEIQRLTDERRELIHNVSDGNFIPIKKHNTSELVSR